MRKNFLKVLNQEQNLPSNLEIMNFNENKITQISPTFFLRFFNLTEVYLEQNSLVSFDNLEFSSTRLRVLSLAQNMIESIESVKFNSKVSLTIDHIDLSGNRLRETPKIRGNVHAIVNLSMSNQRSNDFLQTKKIHSFFNNVPLISGHLSLRNSSLSSICCKLVNVSMESIDLSFNYLNEETLCELFFDVQTNSHGQPLQVVLFPQLGHNPLTCQDLQAYSFRGVAFKDCPLANHPHNEQQCRAATFPVRHTTKLIINSKTVRNFTISNRNNSNASMKIISFSYFVSDHFIAILVVSFFLIILAISTFLFCYQRL